MSQRDKKDALTLAARFDGPIARAVNKSPVVYSRSQQEEWKERAPYLVKIREAGT